MKKLLSLVMAMLLGCGLCAARADANRLGLEILARRYDGEHNQFVSPVSLDYALAMAATGAAGDTLREILDALDVDDPGALEAWNAPLEAAGLRWANAAFARDDLPLDPAYIDALSARFEAELFPLDDAGRVNAWVDEHTDHLIDRLVDELDPDTLLMLVNAIAMDAKWAHPFDPGATWTDTFHAPSGDVEAEFMHDTFLTSYGENDLAQVIRLNYRVGGLYMLLALPKGDDVAEVLDSIVKDGVGWFEGMAPYRVCLSLPKLDISASNTLSDDLQALGIRLAFTDVADFSGISEQPVKISEVIQKARVQMDEEGTRAAAVTAVVLEAAGAVLEEEPPVIFDANRPFVMLIAEETTGAVCFAGVVCNPC